MFYCYIQNNLSLLPSNLFNSFKTNFNCLLFSKLYEILGLKNVCFRYFRILNILIKERYYFYHVYTYRIDITFTLATHKMPIGWDKLLYDISPFNFELKKVFKTGWHFLIFRYICYNNIFFCHLNWRGCDSFIENIIK